MRQFARKFRPLTLVPPASSAAPQQPDQSPLHDHFEGWLSSVAPEIFTVETLKTKATAAPDLQRPLTSVDVLRVHRATLRESHDHRAWPPDVVEKFMNAKVITRRSR